MAAIKTVKVTGSGPEGWVVTTKAGEHTSIIDQPEAMGGTNKGPSPLDYLFVSLGGCLITIAKMVAMQKKINLRQIEVEVSGDVDLEVLRGQNTEDRAGFTNVTADLKVDADLTDEQKEAFIEEVDRRCPISDNIANTTPITVNLVK